MPDFTTERVFDYLKDLVAIPSLSGQEQALAVYCENLLQKAGFQVQRQPVPGMGFNLLAEKRPQVPDAEHLPALLLYAHLDTVPPDPKETEDPFALRYVGERAYGLGVSDMQGGIALILAAIQDLEPKGYRLKVALGVDEEAYSQGAWTLAQSGWCQDVALALVPELSIDSPQEHLGLGRSGCLGFVLTSTGRRQHGAIPIQEPTAIMRALSALSALENFPLQTQEPLPERLVIHGLQAQAEGLTHPDTCTAQGAFFLGPQRSAEQVLAAMQAHLAEHEAVTLRPVSRPTPVASAYLVAVEHAYIAAIQACCEEVLLQQIPQVYGCSVADENVLASICQGPVLSLAPIGGNSHRRGEWIDCKSLVRMVSLYQKILEKAGRFLA